MKKFRRILVTASLALVLLGGVALPAFADTADPQGNTTVAPSPGPSQPPQASPDWWVIFVIITLMTA